MDLDQTQTQTQKMNNTNKNAYEIRLEVLGLAQGELSDKFHETLQSYREKDCREYDKWQDMKERDETDNLLPEMLVTEELINNLKPSMEDIVEKARELYKFIEKG